MTKKALFVLTFGLMISLVLADEDYKISKKLSSDINFAFLDLNKVFEELSKECEDLRLLSSRLNEVCDELRIQANILGNTKTRIDHLLKHYQELNVSPARTFSVSEDLKLTSLLYTKLAANDLVSERIPLHNVRYSSLFELTQLLLSKKLKIIVETGTARDGLDNCNNDGCSTYVLGKIAQKVGAKLYSVDIDPNACRRSREATQSFGDIVTVTESDSVSYLASFNEGIIDFLYLDSYDYDAQNPNPSQEHHKKEIIAGYNKLHKKSIVMVDDCRIENGGKCLLVRNFLLERGWSLYFSSYQQIFIYEE